MPSSVQSAPLTENATEPVIVARAKPLRPRPPPSAPPELVPARMVNEALYCERLLFLEWVNGEWAENHYTLDGTHVHRRADVPGGSLPTPSSDATRADDDRADAGQPTVARSVWLSSERLGLTAKIDLVEGDSRGRVMPLEYKRGRAPDLPEGAYLPERAQLCAQVLLLRDNGFVCDEAAIWFAASRQRVMITIDDALIAKTLETIARARVVCGRSDPPPPLVDSPKCNGCSLVGICLPDETRALREPTSAPFADEPPRADKAVRRLHPSRDDRLPLYVQEQGARVGLDGERLIVVGKDRSETVARLANTSQVCLFGNVQVSSQAIRTLAEAPIPVFFFSYGGWFSGRVVGFDNKNVALRMAQHRVALDAAQCSELARGFVATKIRNSRTLLRRNHPTPDPVVLNHLEQLATKAEQTEALDSLLGLEGTAARDYFGAFTGMLKGAAAAGAFDLDGRNRRPPRDPINALLSFTYSLLTKDVTLAVTAAGLDPMLGFYHQPRFGRPALALDMMEELRPIIADSVVLNALNTGVITDSDFVFLGGACALSAPGRKRLIATYERRLQQEITHPVFGYSISWRRTLEVQARLLGRLLLGEIERFPHFRTR